jgi:hypothetical protein
MYILYIKIPLRSGQIRNISLRIFNIWPKIGLVGVGKPGIKFGRPNDSSLLSLSNGSETFTGDSLQRPSLSTTVTLQESGALSTPIESSYDDLFQYTSKLQNTIL